MSTTLDPPSSRGGPGAECSGAYFVKGIALVQVVQLPAVAVVEQELLDGATGIRLSIHAGIDAVEDPRHTDEQSRLHLSCMDTDLCLCSMCKVRSNKQSRLHVSCMGRSPLSAQCEGSRTAEAWQ